MAGLQAFCENGNCSWAWQGGLLLSSAGVSDTQSWQISVKQLPCAGTALDPGNTPALPCPAGAPGSSQLPAPRARHLLLPHFQTPTIERALATSDSG